MLSWHELKSYDNQITDYTTGLDDYDERSSYQRLYQQRSLEYAKQQDCNRSSSERNRN